MSVRLTHRAAQLADLDLLAEWNHQLIRDEGHRNPMNVAQLKKRMRGWLKAGGYRATLFFFGRQAVAYALYKEDENELYLRQIFVRRDCRCRGIGASAMKLLRKKIWPKKRLTVEVLCVNPAAIKFYRQLGYADYSLTLEIRPRP